MRCCVPDTDSIVSVRNSILSISGASGSYVKSDMRVPCIGSWIVAPAVNMKLVPMVGAPSTDTNKFSKSDFCAGIVYGRAGRFVTVVPLPALLVNDVRTLAA